jgi:hypothetical protein
MSFTWQKKGILPAQTWMRLPQATRSSLPPLASCLRPQQPGFKTGRFTGESEAPEGGMIERDLETGEPNGVLYEMLGLHHGKRHCRP